MIIFNQSPSLLSHRFGSLRHYGVKTSAKTLAAIDLTSSKIQIISKESIKTPLPLSCDWDPITPIRIHHINSSQDDANISKKRTFCYLGGLLALMQAEKKLAESSPDNEILYIRNKEIPKTLMSGHQGHIHPPEWCTEECGFKNLSKALLRGLNLIKLDDPSDLNSYSYLHFTLRIKDWINDPVLQLRIFGSCFYQKIKHSFTASPMGVSKQDQWLCNVVAQSLKMHKELSENIENEMGMPTFTQTSRIYWSPNQEKIKIKEKIWRELGIPVEKMSMEEKINLTLLKKDSPLYILKILSDGKFYPETPERIIQYLSKKYPNFKAVEANVTDIFLSQQGAAKGIEMSLIGSGEIIRKDIFSLFGSTGHNNVLQKGPLTGKWKPLWHEIPVTGVSAVWKCTLSRQELQERWNQSSISDEEIKLRISKIVPAANLSNLHVTSWDCTVNGDKVVMMIRASEGANFNSTEAFKNDLLNMSNNLDRYFIGEWELISVGSCARKTWSSNVPELVELSDNVKFMHGQSGIGYSFSGCNIDSLKHP